MIVAILVLVVLFSVYVVTVNESVVGKVSQMMLISVIKNVVECVSVSFFL